MKLYTRDEIAQIDQLLKTLLRTILGIMQENTETINAWIYTSAEGTADHTCTSYGRIL